MSRFRSEVLDWFDAGRVVRGREREVLARGGVTALARGLARFPRPAHLVARHDRAGGGGHLLLRFQLGRSRPLRQVRPGRGGDPRRLCWPAGGSTWTGCPARPSCVLLSLLTGALLALSGQVYQTGADTFELFAWWAVLILPWVLVSRFSPLVADLARPAQPRRLSSISDLLGRRGAVLDPVRPEHAGPGPRGKRRTASGCAGCGTAGRRGW